MSFLLKIENIAKSSKILISAETFFSRSKDRSRTHDQKPLTLMFTSQNMFVVMLPSDLLDYFQRFTNLAFFQNIGLIPAHKRKKCSC